MTIEIHPQCKERLVAELANQLPTVFVKNNSYLDRKNLFGLYRAGAALPDHGDLVDQLHGFIGEWPLYDFLYGVLAKELHENQEYDSDFPHRRLTELPEYADAIATAQRLIYEFESLPWTYTYSIKFKTFLVQVLQESGNVFEISDQIRLVLPDDGLAEQYPLVSGIEGRDRWLFGKGLLFANEPDEWDFECPYIQIQCAGFVGKYVSTETDHHVRSLLRAFLGLCIALRLIKLDHSFSQFPPKNHFAIHRLLDSGWEIDDTNELSEDVFRAYNDIEFNDLGGQLDTEQKRNTWSVRKLAEVSKVFRSGKEAERLILAGQWFFDSCCGRNELLSFLQAMVVLEILLGDKAVSDAMGLNELLRNRCAYLIGKDHNQREQILREFKDIYDIRSKIVHRGKSKLTSYERYLFHQLQWLCRRVIQEEVNLIDDRGDA